MLRGVIASVLAGRIRGRVCRECPCEVVAPGDVPICIHVSDDCGELASAGSGDGIHVVVAPGRCRDVAASIPMSVFVALDVGRVLRDLAKLPVRDAAIRALAERIVESVVGRVEELARSVAASRASTRRVEQRAESGGDECSRWVSLVEGDAAVLSGSSRTEWRERSRVLREVLGRRPRNVAEVEEAVRRINEILERCGAGVRLVVEGAHIRVVR